MDVHAYPTRKLEYELGTGERPEVCVGVGDTVTPEPLAALVEAVAADHGLGTARNTPFAGTYVPLKRLHDPRVTSVMLEIRRDLYLDEATAHARPLHTVQLSMSAGWRPAAVERGAAPRSRAPRRPGQPARARGPWAGHGCPALAARGGPSGRGHGCPAPPRRGVRVRSVVAGG